MSFADDYLVWDNTEPVTLAWAPFGDACALSVAHALQEAVNQHDYQMGRLSGLSAAATAWLLPQALLDERRPMLDNVIETADGVQWIVRSTTWQAADGVYRCVCVRTPE